MSSRSSFTRAVKTPCCSAIDAGDARRVADKLDIPFHALDFEREFNQIIDYFADEYAIWIAGLSPWKVAAAAPIPFSQPATKGRLTCLVLALALHDVGGGVTCRSTSPRRARIPARPRDT